jgi:hypothetical protein
MARWRRRPNGGEDGVGWIYADLFLALTIVGLGSAIVTVSSPAGGAAPTTVPRTFQLSCREFAVKVPGNLDPGRGGAEIERAIAAEIADRGWTDDVAKPGFVLVMGGFGSAESPGDGDRRAKALLPRLRRSTELLQGVEMRTGGARSVRIDGKNTTVGGAGSFTMVTYLLFSGPPLVEDCTG